MNLRDFFLLPAVVTMADRPRIEKRLRAILDAGQRPGGTGHRMGRVGVAATVFSALAAFAALALLRPVAVRAQQTPGDDTTAAAAQKERQSECLLRLKRLGLAFQMYTQDYDDTMPPLGSPAQMRNRLAPYVRDNAAFTCPETNRPYQPVAPLGGKVVWQVSDPSKTMFVHDALPHPAIPGNAAVNGLWSVGYVDGHVQAVSTLPAIPVLRPLPLAEQRARAAHDRERAARRRTQERLWQQKRGANAIRPQFAPAQRGDARVLQEKRDFVEMVRYYNSLRPFVYRVYANSAKVPGGVAGQPPAELLAPDFVYLRSDGARLDRAAYLAERAGETAASKKAQINRLSVRGREDGAAGEYGVFITRQMGSAPPLTTLDTWVKSPTGWRLRRSEERRAGFSNERTLR